jgi:hypothetical protein
MDVHHAWEILDEMYDFEQEYEEEEKENGSYLIGFYVYMKDVRMLRSGNILEDDEKLYLGMSISAKLFHKYEYKYIHNYLCSAIYCCPQHAKKYNLNTHVMKLDIVDDGLYLVQIKTVWIKLVQRHWKKVIRIRKENIEKRIKDRLRETFLGERKKNPHYYYPTLKGMLYEYVKIINSQEKYKDCH